MNILEIFLFFSGPSLQYKPVFKLLDVKCQTLSPLANIMLIKGGTLKFMVVACQLSQYYIVYVAIKCFGNSEINWLFTAVHFPFYLTLWCLNDSSRCCCCCQRMNSLKIEVIWWDYLPFPLKDKHHCICKLTKRSFGRLLLTAESLLSWLSSGVMKVWSPGHIDKRDQWGRCLLRRSPLPLFSQ